MCTQELIWCACGHGEFLTIQKCKRGALTGLCWTVVHGNHRIVVPNPCSYCLAGCSRRRPLGSPRPTGIVAMKAEQNSDDQLARSLEWPGQVWSNACHYYDDENNNDDDDRDHGREKRARAGTDGGGQAKRDVVETTAMRNKNDHVNYYEASNFPLNDVLSTEFTGGFDLGMDLDPFFDECKTEAIPR